MQYASITVERALFNSSVWCTLCSDVMMVEQAELMKGLSGAYKNSAEY